MLEERKKKEGRRNCKVKGREGEVERREKKRKIRKVWTSGRKER